MEISTFAARLKMEAYKRTTGSQMGARGTFNKVRDGGYWYPMNLRDDIDGYIEDK